MKRVITSAVVALAATGMLASGAGSAEAQAAKHFKNCTAMHKVYKHGVGKKGAKDKTSGKPVTTFKRSNALYKANSKSDRDKDGIACEKR